MKKVLFKIGLSAILALASSFLYASNVVEVKFLEKISKYHDAGIKKSKLALMKSKNIEVEKIAKKFVTQQTSERKKLLKLRAKLYPDIVITESDNNIPGLKELEKVSGTEFDKLYLESMAMQYKNEILITSKMLPELDRAKVHHLAIKILKNRGNEIEKINKIKNKL